MKIPPSPSAAPYIQSASRSTPLAAQQERFLRAILPIALQKFVRCAKLFLRCSPSVKNFFADSAATAVLQAHQTYQRDSQSRLKCFVEEALKILHQQLDRQPAAIKMKAETHAGWQQMIKVVLLSAILCALIGGVLYCFRLNRDLKVATLETALAIREKALQESQAENREILRRINALEIMFEEDGAIWVPRDRVLRTQQIKGRWWISLREPYR